jgi:hypothetical protein
MASSFASSLAAEREEKGSQERGDRAAFIGAEGRHIWQDIGRIEGGEEIARTVVLAKIFGWRLKTLSWR